MNRFRARFKNKHTVLPVVHVEGQDQALRNAQIVATAGGEGLFLVNHEIPSTRLLKVHLEVKRQFPDLWIGVNCLDLTPDWVGAHPEVAGMWSDQAYIFENREEQHSAALLQERIRETSKWGGIYFGGVAFKGQRKVKPADLGDVAVRATSYMDVVTTSGPGTGYAAEVGKIKAMKDAIGEFPLAIASGITPENVHLYMPHADCFLVASGISVDFSNLSLPLTRALVERVSDGSSAA
jgi:hypothetical protein